MKPPVSPKNALDHFMSSQVLEVGAGNARLSLLSSISKPGTTRAYAQ